MTAGPTSMLRSRGSHQPTGPTPSHSQQVPWEGPLGSSGSGAHPLWKRSGGWIERKGQLGGGRSVGGMPHISELADLHLHPGPGSERGYGRCPVGLVHRTCQ